MLLLLAALVLRVCAHPSTASTAHHNTSSTAHPIDCLQKADKLALSLQSAMSERQARGKTRLANAAADSASNLAEHEHHEHEHDQEHPCIACGSPKHSPKHSPVSRTSETSPVEAVAWITELIVSNVDSQEAEQVENCSGHCCHCNCKQFCTTLTLALCS